MTYREIDRILRRNGWVLIRTNGSHCQYKKAECAFLAVVPNHGGKSVSVGVIRSLEKGTGLSLLLG